MAITIPSVLVPIALKYIEGLVGPLLISFVKTLVIYAEATIVGEKKGAERKKFVIDSFKATAKENGITITSIVNLVLSPLIDQCVERNKALLLSLESENSAK